MQYFSQPKFYHFTEDSIKLASFAATSIQRKICENQDPLNCLDIGAGCGVIGLEFFLKIAEDKLINKMTFLEVEEEFRTHLKKNIVEAQKEKKSKTDFNICFSSMGEFKKQHEKFDIILSNPPYYFKGSGKTGKDEKRQKCRFFEVDDLDIFCKLIAMKLAPSGSAFFIGPFEIKKIEKEFLKYGLNIHLICEINPAKKLKIFHILN